MSRHSDGPDWLAVEADRAAKLHKSGRMVNNPSARKTIPKRTLKGFRIRVDYQQRYDVLLATLKHAKGKKGPELIEEALELLFRKYERE